MRLSSITPSRPLFLTCLCICLLSIQIPVWLPNTLPFTDYPVHLSLIQAIDLSANTPSTLKNNFETHWFSPYSVTYLLGQSMTLLFSVETIGRILLGTYLLLTPLLFFRFMRSIGKPPYLAFPICLLLFNFNMSWGFLSFLTAIPLVIESSTQSYLYLKKASWKQGLFLSCLFVLLFFTHIFALILGLGFLLCSFIAGLIVDKKIFSASLIPFVSLPAVILAVIWRFTLVLTKNDFYFLDKGVRYASLMTKIKYFPDYCISGDSGNTYRVIFACLVAMILLKFLPSPSNNDKRKHVKMSDIASNANLRINRLENLYGQFCFIVIVVIYLVCPYSWLTAVWLFNRVAFLVPVYSLALLPRSSRLHPALFIPGTTVLCIGLSFYTLHCYKSFSDEARKGRDIIRLIPAEKSLSYAAFDNRSVFADHEPYLHFGQYYQLDKNGSVYNPFATLAHIPIRYTPEYMAMESRFLTEQILKNNQITVDLEFDRSDYFLFRTHELESRKNLIQRLFPNSHESIVTVSYDDKWLLLNKTGGAN